MAFQFAVSGALIVCTLGMERQMDYLHQAKLGFDEEHVVVIDGTEVLSDRIEAFRRRIATVAGVSEVTNAQSVPGRDLAEMTVQIGREAMAVSAMTVGFNYAHTLGLNIVAGRDFSADFPSDSTSVLLNASAAAALEVESIGSTLLAEGREYRVVGIVEDYHYASLRDAIGPLVIFGPDPWNQARPNFLVPVRIQPGRLDRTLAGLERVWNDFVPGQPFVYSFLDEEFGRLYRSEERTHRLFGLFSLLAIVIACLGLFGLAAFSAQRRTKEIGIRKVLGASIPDIAASLSGRFVTLVIVGFVAASPIAYLVMQRWLGDFAYRIELGAGLFVAAGAIMVFIALATIGYHVVRASLVNPVETLQYE